MSIRYPYPEFDFYGVSVYRELGTIDGRTYFSSAETADVSITNVPANEIKDSSKNPLFPFKFTVSARNYHRSIDIEDVQLFFFAPATCKDEDQRAHVNSPSHDDEAFEELRNDEELRDDFVEVESQNSLSAKKEGTLDSISFKRATEHGLFVCAQNLHSHIFDFCGSSSRPRTVRMVVHDETVEFRDILKSKGWVFDF